jgi:sphingosine-1-phosphate phosphatase 1
MLHYVLTYGACNGFMIVIGLSLALLQVILIGIGEFLLPSCHILLELLKDTYDMAYLKLLARVYLGMHSLTDVIAGICLGIVILAFWLVVDDHVDAFVVSGQNGMSICLS